MLNVVYLWHMHQPYYVNPMTKTAMMPWVRLHSVKGYLDMIDVVRRYPDLRVSFNFTPVLVKQLEELANREVIDLWETWSRIPPEDLTDEQKSRILENFFKIHWDNLIMPHPRYRQLLEIRGRQYDLSSLPESVKHFTDQDYRDLQTWYNLGWCGFSAEKRFPELTGLKKKGSNFTEQEKNRVLDIHHEIVRMILRLYREAQEQGQIEVTTTPFFHPIMPLVYDTNFAKRCMPGAPLPPRFTAPDDVRAHLRLAQEQHERVFGKKARGLWPSEGSVCPEILPLLKEAGIEYFCTDEGVLFRGLHDEGRQVDHLELFQTWSCEYQGAQLKALFRERPLSDFIGFNAARNTASASSDHLSYHLQHLAEVVKHPNGAVCLALDGENAWECFPDGGESFLCQMYEKILGNPNLKTKRLGDYIDSCKETPVTYRLHTGSWINSDFDIWIGSSEENQGWDWINKTRAFLTEKVATGQYGKETLDKAWLEIYAAEGSDWFWWYGDDFQTDCDFLFDELFRTHLQNVYRIFDCEPPKYLDVPICLDTSKSSSLTPPVDYISPQLEDSNRAYYDWLGAGVYDVATQQTAMFQADRIGKRILFGFDDEKFYLRFETTGHVPQKLVIYFNAPSVVRITVDVKGKAAWIEKSADGVQFEKSDVKPEYTSLKGVILSVPIKELGWRQKSELVGFIVQVIEGNLERERYPERGLIEFTGPSPEFKLRNWFI